MDTKKIKLYAFAAAGVVVVLSLLRNGNSNRGANAGAIDSNAWLQSKAIDAQTSVAMSQIVSNSNNIAAAQVTQRQQNVFQLVDSLNTNSIAQKELGYANTLAIANARNTTELAVERQKSADYVKMLDQQLAIQQIQAQTQLKQAGIGADTELTKELLSLFGSIVNNNTSSQTNHSTMGGGSAGMPGGFDPSSIMNMFGGGGGSSAAGAGAGALGMTSIAEGAGAYAGGAEVADLGAVALLA